MAENLLIETQFPSQSSDAGSAGSLLGIDPLATTPLDEGSFGSPAAPFDAAEDEGSFGVSPEPSTPADEGSFGADSGGGVGGDLFDENPNRRGFGERGGVGGDKPAPDPRVLELDPDDKLPSHMSGDDLDSLNMVPIDREQLGILAIGLVTDAERELWAKQAEIGFWENAYRSRYNIVPGVGLYSQAKLFNVVTRLRDDMINEQRMKNIKRGIIEKDHLGFVPQGAFAQFGISGIGGLGHLGLSPFQAEPRSVNAKNADILVLNQHIKQLVEADIRGTTIGGHISKGSAEMSEFLLAFILSGGYAAIGKEVAEQAFKKTVGRFTKTIIGNVTKKLVGNIAGGLVATTLSPQLTAKEYMRRRVESMLVPTEAGWKILVNSKESEVKSLFLAFGSVFVEMFSERLGPGLTGTANKLKRITGGAITKLPGGKQLARFKKSLEVAFVTSKTAKKGFKLWTKAGYNGFLEELGEERVAALMHAIFGTSKRPGDNSGVSVMDVFQAVFPSFEELAIEAGIIGIIGSTRSITMAMGVLADLPKNRKKKIPEKPLTPDQVELILEIAREKQADKDAGIAEVSAAKESLALTPEAIEKAQPKDQAGKPVKQAPVVPEAKEPEVDNTKVSPAEKLILEGRQERLREEEDRIFSELNTLGEQRDAAAAKGRRTKGLDEKIDKLANRINQISLELLNIVGKGVNAKEKLTTSPLKVLNTIRAIIKSNRRQTKEQVKDLQEQFLAAVRATVPLAERGVFITALKNINTVKQLDNALSSLEIAAAKISEKLARKQVLKRVNRLVKQSRLKKGGGKPKGKFTANVQAALDKIRKATKLKGQATESEIKEGEKQADKTQSRIEEVSKLSPEAAQAKVDENIDAITKAQNDGKALPFDLALENAIIQQFSDLKGRSLKELRTIESRLRSLIEHGKLEKVNDALEKAARRLTIIATSRAVFQGDKPITNEDKPVGPATKKLKQILKRFLFTQTGWRHLLDMLSQHDRTSKQFKSFVSRILDVGHLEEKEKGDVDRDARTALEFVRRAYGLKNERKASAKMAEGLKEQDYGMFIDASGARVRLAVSKQEAISLYMQLQTPEVAESLRSEEGGFQSEGRLVKGLTPAMEAALFEGQHEHSLSPQDKQFGDAVLAWYKEFYARVNEVYRQDYGVDLPQIENYSPIRRVIDTSVAESFFDEMNIRRTATPSSTITRTQNRRPIQVQGVLDAMQRHSLEMNHYIAWSAKLRDINAVFGDSQNRIIIKQKYGGVMLTAIDKFVQDFTRNGRTKAEAHDAWASVAKALITISTLTLKPKQLFMQMVSSLAVISKVSPHRIIQHWTSLVTIGPDGKFSLNAFSKNFKKLQQLSDLIATRRGVPTRDLNDARLRQALGHFRQRPTFQRMLGIFISIGDLGGALFAGWPVYQEARREGRSDRMAINEMQEFIADTQQSPNLSQLSDQQRGSPFSQLMTMYMSAQNQLMRQELSAIRNGLRGRASVAETARLLFTYHIVIPQFIQMVANFGDWDDEDQLVAGLTGTLNGVFILKDVVDGVMALIVNQLVDDDVDVFTSSHPLFNIINDLMNGLTKAGRSVHSEGIDSQLMMEAVIDLTKDVGGPATGLPLKQLGNIREGIQHMTPGPTNEGREPDAWRGFQIMMGWSPYSTHKRLDQQEFE